MWKIPLFDTALDEAESDAVLAVLRSGWLTMGDNVRRFEEGFARHAGVAHAVAVTNCTAGLHLVHAALEIGAGDEVVCPALSFVAAGNSVLHVGARPVFADLGSLDLLVPSAETIESRITSKTRAIQVMHYSGRPCPMPSILAVAEAHGLPVIEDCAHAPGAELDGRRCGSLGRAGVFSFFSNKNLTTGEGGMVTTDDADLAARLRLMRSHGMTSSTVDRHRGHAYSYDVLRMGFNFRMDEMRAALGLAQLAKLDARNARRGEIDARYRSVLEQVEGVTLPFAGSTGRSSFHIFPVLLASDADRGAVMQRMAGEKIQTSIHYPPIHLFRHYREHHGYREGDLPLTEEAGRRLLTLPLYPGMSDADVDLVCATLRESIS